jgi:hypothetical protein
MTHSAFSKAAALVALGALAGCANLQAVRERSLTPSGRAAIAQASASHLARVEYTVQYDKGEPPVAGAYPVGEIAGFVSQERPLELPGFVLSPTLVVCPDPIIHPRFVKSIAVRYGDQLIPADPSAYGKDQNALFLQLAQPLKDAKPLVFDANAKPPYLVVTYQLNNHEWIIYVTGLTSAVRQNETGRSFSPLSACCLLVDGEGKPVGMTMGNSLPMEGSWQGSPQTWPAVSAKEMKALLSDIHARADRSLLRVALSFRSPKKAAGSMFRRSDQDEDESTERNVIGVMVDDKTVLVLADLKPVVTARLERILVHRSKGKPVPATFSGTLKDYGAFIATLAEPLEGSVQLSGDPVQDVGDMLLVAAEVMLQGEKRITYFNHGRIESFRLGWRRQVYPVLAGASSRTFLFTPEGKLVAFPISRRAKVSQGSSREGRPVLTAATYIKALLTEVDRHVDASNVPLSEDQEDRLAWLGVELQPLDKELARINNVSDLTRDGQIGAIVSYVYEDSPAAKAGIKPGNVLLRLHVEDEPKPLEVRVEEYGFGAGASFPWEQLDQVPERYLNEIPTPWPPAANNLNLQLTEIGFGKKFTAEFSTDGQVMTKDFEVVQSPPYYDSAARVKSDALGLTVRDLTYEVRRYFQKAADEGGVIVSKVEPGSKAAVSGLKPYEIITHVNDKAVGGVKDFEKLIAGQDELRLSVKRMTKGRVVKIKTTAAKPETPATTQASQPATRRPIRPTTTQTSQPATHPLAPATITEAAPTEPQEPQTPIKSTTPGNEE